MLKKRKPFKEYQLDLLGDHTKVFRVEVSKIRDFVPFSPGITHIYLHDTDIYGKPSFRPVRATLDTVILALENCRGSKHLEIVEEPVSYAYELDNRFNRQVEAPNGS